MKMRSTIISGVKDTVPNTLSLRIEDLSETETSLLGWEGGKVGGWLKGGRERGQHWTGVTGVRCRRSVRRDRW